MRSWLLPLSEKKLVPNLENAPLEERGVMLRRRRRRIPVVLAVVGAVSVVFGAIWMTVIFPEISKVPSDLATSTTQAGTVTVLDSETMQPVTYNVIGTRAYETMCCSGDVLYVKEVCTFVDADTGVPLPEETGSTILLAVDRVSRENVAGHGDKNREGCWSFPHDVKAGQDYPYWITGNPTVLDARYVGEEDFEGLSVLVYEIATPEEGITVPAGLFTPEQTLHQWIRMLVEPVSGTPVYMESTNKRTTMVPVTDELFPNTGPMTFAEVTVYEDDLVFTEATKEQLLHDARYYHWALPWGSHHLQWTSIGLGVALVVVGFVLLTREEPIELPVPEPVEDEVASQTR